MKNKVLVKLAQTRLAINHVLRNRMHKCAGGSFHKYVNPGDPEYDADFGAVPYSSRSYYPKFKSYDAANPPQPFYKRYPLRNTTNKLTSRNISNPAENPYLSDNNIEQYQTEVNNSWLDNPGDRLHRKLFGLPSPRTAVDLDKNNLEYNTRVVSADTRIPAQYFAQYTMAPLREQAEEATGLDRISYIRFKGDPLEYKFHINDVIDGDMQQDTDYGTYVPVEALAANVQVPATRKLDVPLSPQIAAAISNYQDAQKQYEFMNDQASVNQNRYTLNNKLPGRTAYRNKRNQLMHSYINQSPVGQAFAFHPSMMTGIPYAAYHAMPYLWKGNQPMWMQQGINNAKNLYYKATGQKSPREIALEEQQRGGQRIQRQQDKWALRRLQKNIDEGLELSPAELETYRKLLKQLGKE